MSRNGQLYSTAPATMKMRLTVLTRNHLRVVQDLALQQTKNPQKESHICHVVINSKKVTSTTVKDSLSSYLSTILKPKMRLDSWTAEIDKDY